MSSEFEATLEKIKGRPLSTFIEKAIETGVILPLLRQVGWNTDDPTEVKPEHWTDAGAVDWALRIGDANRVFIEAKAGHVDLKNCEDQIEGYCRAGKPSLAVLTNGSHWWLYLPPPTRPKDAKIRRFLEFDINDDPEDVEEKFRQFLTRDKMSNRQSVKRTVEAAVGLFKERQNHAAVMKGLVDTWNEFAGDRQVKAKVLAYLTEGAEYQPDAKHIEDFLNSVEGLVNLVPDGTIPSKIKPMSFTFQEPDKKLVSRPAMGWVALLLGFCGLMQELHPDTFKKIALELPGLFSESGSGKWQMGNTGVYVKPFAEKVKFLKYHPVLLEKFGYPADSLTVQYKDG